VSPKLEGVDIAVTLGESGGVDCSVGLINCSIVGSLHSYFSGIVTFRGDSCHFPVIGNGCSPAQLGGPSLLTNGSSSVSGCLGNGVVWIGEIHGGHDDDATGVEVKSVVGMVMMQQRVEGFLPAGVLCSMDRESLELHFFEVVKELLIVVMVL